MQVKESLDTINYMEGMERHIKGYLFQTTTSTKDPSKHNIPTEIKDVLRNFKSVFQEPTCLSPIRGHEHHIILQDGTNLVSVRSYRYPRCQKNEIEKLVEELLHIGFIRPSQSPYSSQVLLVKKSDKTWRLWIDYMALNKAIVKDKFPIPVVDELLDELTGAKLFTKLDLKSGYHQIRMATSDIQKHLLELMKDIMSF